MLLVRRAVPRSAVREVDVRWCRNSSVGVRADHENASARAIGHLGLAGAAAPLRQKICQIATATQEGAYIGLIRGLIAF